MAGDVQGNTTNVISNQQGSDINHDGNDKKILQEGAEKETDDISKIELISFAEYNSLPDNEKTKYVRYNPSLQSMAYAQWLALQKQAIAGFNDFGPMIEKMQVLEKLPLNDIKKQLEPIKQSFKTATDTINSLTSAPIIGQLAAPVFNVVLALGQMCGYLYSLVINPVNMFTAYKDAFDSLDMSNYKELFKPAEGTPNIDEQLAEKELEMTKVIIPDKEIKDLYERQKNVVKDQFDDIASEYDATYQSCVDLLDTTKRAMDTIDACMGAFSLGSATMAKKMFDSSYKLSKLQYEKNYNEKANKLAEKINGFESKIPVKYIKAEDLEKLKTKQKTTDAPVKDSMYEWSSKIDYTEEEVQQESDETKAAALEKAKVLQKIQNVDRDIATIKSQIEDLDNQMAPYNKTIESDETIIANADKKIIAANAILNNPDSTSEEKSQAETIKKSAEIEKELAEIEKSQAELAKIPYESQKTVLTNNLNAKNSQRDAIIRDL